MEIEPFTNDTDKLIAVMNKVTAFGGGDLPEDVHGGLDVCFKIKKNFLFMMNNNKVWHILT